VSLCGQTFEIGKNFKVLQAVVGAAQSIYLFPELSVSQLLE
jgi:hypothetical protein